MVVVVGLATAALATAVGGLVLAGRPPTYVAHAQVVLVAPAGTDPATELRVTSLLGTDQPARTAAAVFSAPMTGAGAARAAGLEPAEITVSAAAVPGTGAVDLSVTAPTPADAEAATQALVDTATPQVVAVSGPFQLRVVGSPAGTATSAGVLSSLVLVAVATAAMVLGCATALGARVLMVRRGARR